MMRKLLLALLLMGLAIPCKAVVSPPVNTVVQANAGQSLTAVAPSFANNYGNTIICGVFWADASALNVSTAGDTFTVTDTAGNSYNGASPDVRLNTTTTWNTTLAIVHASTIAQTQNNVVTLTVTTGNQGWYAALSCTQWKGILNASPLDQTGTVQTAAAAPSPVTVTAGGPTVQANELVYAFDASNSGPNVAGASYTALNQLGGPVKGLDEYQIVSSINTYSATETFSGTATNWAVLATFKAAPPQGGSTHF